MPLVTQQGEVADRLRRFFRIAGRIPSTVDETVVPTVNLQALDRPPWRLTARNGAVYTETAAAAGLNSFAAVQMTFGSPGVLVVSDCWIRNNDLTLRSFSLFLVANAEAVAGFAAGAQLADLENMNPGTAGATVARLPPRAASFSTTPLPFGTEIWRGNIAPEAHYHLRLRREVVLRGDGYGLGKVSQSLCVACRTVNLSAAMTVHGTYYPDAL